MTSVEEKTLVFNVLDRKTKINQHLLIEASAGTGKTFTIEHLFVRRLLEPTEDFSFLSVKEIAIVTFTRACAYELSCRIKKTLIQALEFLQKGDKASSDIPDYLLKIKEESSEALAFAKRRLRDAKTYLDEAMITTIHGFCERTLSEYYSQTSSNTEEKGFATQGQIQEIIQDYLKICAEFEPIEFEILLKKHFLDVSEFINAVSQNLWQERNADLETLAELSAKLKREAEKVQLETGWTAEYVVENLEILSQSFCGLRDKNDELKDEVREKFAIFSRLFLSNWSDADRDALIKLPLVFEHEFEKPKASCKDQSFLFLDVMKAHFDEFIKKISDYDAIFSRFMEKCEPFVTKVLRQKGLTSPQDILLQMNEAVNKPEFLDFLRKRFRAVFVDEFQDTDHIQWNIFLKAFLQDQSQEKKRYLYLVGDPKQAIYSFRGADVANYLKAKDFMKNEEVVQLSTNFRSSPKLCAAMNTLFVGGHSKEAFSLKETDAHIDIQKVISGGKTEDFEEVNEGKSQLHFFVHKDSLGKKRRWPHDEAEKMLFSFIAQEIVLLKNQGSSFDKMAILVKDRNQSRRIKEYLEARGILVSSYRGQSVIHSQAFKLLYTLLQLLERPRKRELLLEFLANEPFSITDESARKIVGDDEAGIAYWAEYVKLILELRNSYDEKGFAVFFEEFLNLKFVDERSVKERILTLPHGQAFLQDLEQLFELFFEKDMSVNLQEAISFLRELKELPDKEQEELSQRYEVDVERVQLLTMHKSKGLEFEIVFALGVSSRTLADKELSEDSDQEKMRQFYVACTRAKKRLYLPVLQELDGKTIKRGTASPQELFLAHIAKANKNDERTDIYEIVSAQSQMEAITYLKTNSPYISVSEVVPQETKYIVPECVPMLMPMPQLWPEKIDAERITLESFSKIVQKLEEPFVPEKKEEKKASKLPYGPHIGLILHELLEEFLMNPTKDDDELFAKVSSRISPTALKGFETEVTQILKNVFELKLSPYDFCVRDIAEKNAFSEAEFLLENSPNHYLRGVVDFAFAYQGDFYLIDWKSNFLGIDEESYSEQNLKEAIRLHGYDLQASIYADAYCKFLRDQNIPAERFKGFYFVFLRGLEWQEKGLLFLPKDVLTCC